MRIAGITTAGRRAANHAPRDAFSRAGRESRPGWRWEAARRPEQEGIAKLIKPRDAVIEPVRGKE